MAEYRLDKTAFKIMTYKEADAANVFDKNTPYAERLRQAHYLISQAYGFSLNEEPRLDKTHF